MQHRISRAERHMSCILRGGRISGHMAKDVFTEMVSSGRTAGAIVEEKGMSQLSDEEKLKELAAGLVRAHPGEAGRYRSGKEGLLGFFVGKLMEETGGKANPKLASRIMKELLNL